MNARDGEGRAPLRVAAKRGGEVGARRGGWVFALPWLVGLLGLSLLPMLASFGLSLTRWDGLSVRDGVHWAGFDNYREIVGGDDALFERALLNSLYYTVIAVPVGVATSLVFALLLNARVAGRGVFRTLFMLPYMLGGVAIALVWSWVFNPRFGLMNRLLGGLYRAIDPVVRLFGETGTSEWVLPDWFYSPETCKPALVIMHLWIGGGTMLVFLAALQRVPRSLSEAAELDGAGRWHRFRHVTLVHISPAVLFNLVVGVVFAMQTFDEAYLLQNRAQQDGLLFYGLHLYRVAFESPYRLGYASALAWILFVVIAVLAVPLLVLAKRVVYYAGER